MSYVVRGTENRNYSGVDVPNNSCDDGSISSLSFDGGDEEEESSGFYEDEVRSRQEPSSNGVFTVNDLATLQRLSQEEIERQTLQMLIRARDRERRTEEMFEECRKNRVEHEQRMDVMRKQHEQQMEEMRRQHDEYMRTWNMNKLLHAIAMNCDDPLIKACILMLL